MWCTHVQTLVHTECTTQRTVRRGHTIWFSLYNVVSRQICWQHLLFLRKEVKSESATNENFPSWSLHVCNVFRVEDWMFVLISNSMIFLKMLISIPCKWKLNKNWSSRRTSYSYFFLETKMPPSFTLTIWIKPLSISPSLQKKKRESSNVCSIYRVDTKLWFWREKVQKKSMRTILSQSYQDATLNFQTLCVDVDQGAPATTVEGMGYLCAHSRNKNDWHCYMQMFWGFFLFFVFCFTSACFLFLPSHPFAFFGEKNSKLQFSVSTLI